MSNLGSFNVNLELQSPGLTHFITDAFVATVLTMRIEIDMRHIGYQGETLPLVLAFHLVLGKFYI